MNTKLIAIMAVAAGCLLAGNNAMAKKNEKVIKATPVATERTGVDAAKPGVDATSPKGELLYYDARQYPLLGTLTPGQKRNNWVRLPDSLENKTNETLWRWGNSPAGMAIRFSSNTTKIGVKFNQATLFQMNHMTYTGIHGVDLYMLADNGKWEYVGAGRPSSTKKPYKGTLMSNMVKKDREYMLFLPLYDGLDSLYIGVDSAATMGMPKVDLPKRGKPVVTFSTSIGEGGCATRPGMVHTAIMQRELQREIVNMGFSGSAQLQPEIAKVMASVEASMFIIDCLPNCTSQMLKDRLIPFVDILRAAQPNVPILFVESPIFPVCRLDQVTGATIKEKNETYHKLYEEMVAKGYKNLHYMYGDAIIGDEWDNTVDNYHFTDKGFVRFAHILEPYIITYALQ